MRSAEDSTAPAGPLERPSAAECQSDDQAQPTTPLPTASLAEALATEMAECWQKGERIAAETCLRRYPTVAADAEAACVVIYAEFLLRQQAGEEPSLAEYQQRFPKCAQELATLHEFERLNEMLPWFAVDDVAEASTKHKPCPPMDHRAVPSIPDYELVERIGAGAFGEVWRARNKHDLGWFAVKVVPKIFRIELNGVRLYRQYAAGHRNLVPIHHVGECARGFYYVMPLADAAGEAADAATATPYQALTLHRHLRKRGTRPIAEVLDIGQQLLDALGHLHGQGVSHCDVKPENIVRIAGVWCLGDVGLMTERAQLGQERGTEAFWPPEGPRDQSADLYALGKTLYLLATGGRLEHFAEYLTTPLPVGKASRPAEDLRSILRRACADTPAQRFGSAAEMRDAVAQVAARPKRQRRRRWAIAATLALVLLAMAGWYLRPLEPWQRTLTPAETLICNELAKTATKQRMAGEWAAATDSLRQHVELLERRLGPDDPRTVDVNLQLQSAQRVASLEPDAQKQIALTWQHRTLELADEGKLDDAIVLQRAELETRIRCLGDDEYTTAMCRLFLGSLLYERGDLDEGDKQTTHAVASVRKNWPAPYPSDFVPIGNNNLAAAQVRRGKFELALPLLSETLKIRQHVHGPHHSYAGISHLNYAECLRQMAATVHSDRGWQYLKEAELHFLKAADIIEQAQDGRRFDIAGLVGRLARYRDREGKYLEAQLFHEKAWQMITECPDAPAKKVYNIRLGRQLNRMWQGKLDSAFQVGQDTFPILMCEYSIRRPRWQ